FDLVDILTAAIVAMPRIAFGVLVGEHAAGRLEHGLRHEVLRGDELDFLLLAPTLALNGGEDLPIGLSQRCHAKRRMRRRATPGGSSHRSRLAMGVERRSGAGPHIMGSGSATRRQPATG